MTNKVYQEFGQDVLSVISDSERFSSSKIKILQKQMSIGKSHFQGSELTLLLKSHFSNLKFIFRISPTTEVADDGVFDSVSEHPGFRSRDIKNIKNVSEYLEDLTDTSNIYCFSLTHQRFADQFDEFIKYADKSVLLIEEAHQFVGVGDEGDMKYGFVSGFRSPYYAETANRIRKWLHINGRVLGFTATPTIHHEGFENIIPGTNEKLSTLFDLANNLAKVEDIVFVQSWLNRVKCYDFKMRDPQDSVRKNVYDAVDSLFEREEKLQFLSKKDKNINTKLTGLFMCGQGKGVWGCPIHSNKHHDEGMVEIISDYVLGKGFDPSSKMIATMQEESSGGIRIWDLDGNCEKVKTFSELKNRMMDPNDELRYLIVINRARSGISISNLGAIVVGVVRDPTVSRTYIPLQVYGRLMRANPGTGFLITKQYKNNLEEYLSSYPTDFDVDIETVIETIKVSNYFDVWYPKDADSKAYDVWGDAIRDLKKHYCNSTEFGYSELHRITCTKPPITSGRFLPLEIDKELLCPHCGKSVYDAVDEWRGDGTLDRFFNLN